MMGVYRCSDSCTVTQPFPASFSYLLGDIADACASADFFVGCTVVSVNSEIAPCIKDPEPTLSFTASLVFLAIGLQTR